MCIKAPTVNAPTMPKPEKTLDERKARLLSEEERRRKLAMGGIQSTILSQGNSATGKTLLGQ